MKLLLVEDDVSIQESLKRYLESEKFQVQIAPSIKIAKELYGAHRFDLILLDWNLPDGNGFDLLCEWRKKDLLTPMMLVTARVDTIDKVLALEGGANDYIVKPFDPRELLARIRVNLRRLGGTDTLSVAGIEMNINTREVSYANKKWPLTRLEFDLLRLFLENPNKVYSRDELLNRVWGYDETPTTRTVDNYVLSLRQKFGEERFETLRNVGYRFRKDPKA